jgi:hypothetical protein
LIPTRAKTWQEVKKADQDYQTAYHGEEGGCGMGFGGGWRLLHDGESCLCVKIYSGSELF